MHYNSLFLHCCEILLQSESGLLGIFTGLKSRVQRMLWNTRALQCYFFWIPFKSLGFVVTD